MLYPVCLLQAMAPSVKKRWKVTKSNFLFVTTHWFFVVFEITSRGHHSLPLTWVQTWTVPAAVPAFSLGCCNSTVILLFHKYSLARRDSSFDACCQRSGFWGSFTAWHRNQWICTSLIIVISCQPTGVFISVSVICNHYSHYNGHSLMFGYNWAHFYFLWPDFYCVLQEFDESYMQTGQGQLYSWSSQTHQRGGSPMVLRCNHSIIYEGQEERQGPLLQLLRVSGMNSVYNMLTLSLDFHITASLLIPGLKEKKYLI